MKAIQLSCTGVQNNNTEKTAHSGGFLVRQFPRQIKVYLSNRCKIIPFAGEGVSQSDGVVGV